ncbi:MAG: CDP-alcohol phosphatidyltransferase family protein [Promethearchaeota archaeon]
MNSDTPDNTEKHPIEGPISRNLNRRMSRPIASHIKDVSWLTPNRVSVIALLFAILAAFSYSFGNLLMPGEWHAFGLFIISPTLVIGGTLVQLSSIIDGVDGDLARIRSVSSDRGAIFDAVLDRYADIVILVGIAYPLLRNATDIEVLPGSPLNLMVSQDIVFIILVAAVLGSLMVSYSRARLEAVELFSIHGWVSFGATRDVRLFLIFVCSLLSYTFIALLMIAIMGNLTVLFRLLSILRKEKPEEDNQFA